MAKFEESRADHEVHTMHHPQGHGLLDQKHAKGMRSPMLSQIPSADAGSASGVDGAGQPGMPSGEYGSGSVTGS
jgi:hypothetical protein